MKELLRSCIDFTDFSLYRITADSETGTLETLEFKYLNELIKTNQELDQKKSQKSIDLVAKLKREGAGKARDIIHAAIEKLHQAVLEGKTIDIQKILDTKIPKEALFLISGHESE